MNDSTSTLQNKLNREGSRPEGVDYTIIEREEEHPMLTPCTECRFPCKKHTGTGWLTFVCNDFISGK